jgi:hypothetical protein
MVATLTLGGTGVVIDSAGSGSFRVVGALTVPQVVTATNYGGYRTSTAATVSMTDAVASTEA